MKNIIFNGALNLDLAPKFLKQEDYVGARNIIFQTSKDGNAGILRMYPGFVAATAESGTTIPANSVEVGTFENKVRREVYFFLYDPLGQHGIYKYKQSNEKYEKVLVWSGLNFNPSYLITGIAMIGDYLFWTDNLNQPRYINVTRAYTNVIEEDITLIRPAPLYPLDYDIELETSTYSPLTGNAYQFSYRYVYLDNQISVIAPYTENIYCEQANDLAKSIYLQKPVYEELPKYLREVELLVRRNDSDNWQIWKTVTPEEFGGNVTIEVLATQLASPYVDANTLVVANGEQYVWEFFEGTLVGPTSFAPGSSFQVQNYNIEAPDFGAAIPELRVDIYRNGVLWQRLSQLISYTGESIIFNFVGEAGNIYQIYSYATDDGNPNANPFTNSLKGFRFFGDRLGRAVPIQETVKSFESVPLLSKSLEVARDRVSLGWNTEGYNQYEIPSLKVILEEVDVNVQLKTLEVWRQEINYLEESYDIIPGTISLSSVTEVYYLKDGEKFYFFKNGDYSSVSSINGDYFLAGDYTGAETTASIGEVEFKIESDLEFTEESGVQGDGTMYSLRTAVIEKVDPEHLVDTTFQVQDTVGSTKFKNKSQYQVGIVFYDRYLRNQGVYTNDSCLATIDDDFRGSTIDSIRWEVSSTDKLSIPEWAHSYQIVRTDNLSKVTFLQGKTSDIYWAYMEADVLKYSRSYRADAEYVEIDISGSFKAGLRYNFAEGDLIDLEFTTGIKTYEIIGSLGSKLRILPVSESEFETTVSPFPVRLFFEIWRRKDIVDDLIFYEVSTVLPVVNRGTVNRDFSATTGYLKGDVVVIEFDHYDYANSRTLTSGAFTDNTLDPTPVTITIEAPNIDNDLSVGWIKSLGRVNAELRIGQIVKETAIRWSNRFIQGTRVNGTSNFEVNDEKQLSIEVGPIYKLQLTSKTQQEGTVMLAICGIECVSLYLGETQFIDNVSRNLVGSTVEVIGTTNVLNGGAGTIHPQSVVYHNGRVWWWDFYNSRVLRYDPNGIRDLAELGMKSYFYQKSVPTTGYDPFHNLFFIGFGSDMLSFDEDANQWRSYYDFVPGYCSKVEDFLIAFKNGIPYRSNHTNLATYFSGQQNGVYEFYVSAGNPEILDNIALYATEVFTWSGGKQVVADLFEILATNEAGQSTSLIYTDFEINESVLYAHFFRDANSSGGLRQGEVMRNDVHKIRVTLKGNIGFETITINDSKSSGH